MVLDSFSQAGTRGRHVNIYYIAVTYHLGTDDVSPLSVYDVPAARLPNKREVAGACHGNLTTLRGFA